MPPPYVEIGIVLVSLIAGLALLVAGLSVWLYAGVVAIGGSLAFSIGVARAGRLRPAIEDVRRETGYTPWVETVWPSWARKLFFAYLALVVLLAVGLIILALAVAFAERFG